MCMLATPSKVLSKSYQGVIDTCSLKKKIEDYIEEKVNNLEEGYR